MKESRTTALLRLTSDASDKAAAFKEFCALVSGDTPPHMRASRRRTTLTVDGVLPPSITCLRPLVAVRNGYSWVQEMRRALAREYP